jgi:hypothetical protein
LVSEYRGEALVAVAATQHPVTRSRAVQMVDEWCEFFRSGPSPIERLEFTSRTPKRLFAALASQTQIRSLTLKWGDYDDLSVLAGMRGLSELHMGSATAITDLAPLASLPTLRKLTIEGAFRIRDYTPLGQMERLEQLGIYSSPHGSPVLHTDSAEFLTTMSALRTLGFDVVIDTGDYSPFLRLPHVEWIYLKKSRNMSPSYADLEWAVPGIAHMEQQILLRDQTTTWAATTADEFFATPPAAVESLPDPQDEFWHDGDNTR